MELTYHQSNVGSSMLLLSPQKQFLNYLCWIQIHTIANNLVSDCGKNGVAALYIYRRSVGASDINHGHSSSSDTHSHFLSSTLSSMVGMHVGPSRKETWVNS